MGNAAVDFDGKTEVRQGVCVKLPCRKRFCVFAFQGHPILSVLGFFSLDSVQL
jgi:hypothetical protein